MGILQTIGQSIGSFFGKVPPGDAEDYELTGPYDEKIKSGPWVSRFPLFLPFFDEQQSVYETAAMRAAYRKMLSDPNVKSPLLNQILSAAASKINVMPYRKRNPDDQEQARFVGWALRNRLVGGIPGAMWSIFSGGLLDGFSVCEKVWGVHEEGEYENYTVLRKLKPKDVDNDLVLTVDQYRNVTGYMGIRYNAGEIYPPHYFLRYEHFPLFGNPTGMSALRAVYSRYWMLDTVIKIRALGAEKRALPIIVGEYTDQSKQRTLENILASVKSRNWLSIPASVRIKALDIAGSSEDYFKSFVADLREEIVLGIQGATLQSMAGRVGQLRGDSDVHKATADVWKWWLVVMFVSLLNDPEDGLIREMVGYNYGPVPGYPYATSEEKDEKALTNSLQIDRNLKDLGFVQSKEDLEDRYDRQAMEYHPLGFMPGGYTAAGAAPVGPNQQGQALDPKDNLDPAEKVRGLLDPDLTDTQGANRASADDPTLQNAVGGTGGVRFAEEPPPPNRTPPNRVPTPTAPEDTSAFDPREWMQVTGERGGRWARHLPTGNVITEKEFQQKLAKYKAAGSPAKRLPDEPPGGAGSGRAADPRPAPARPALEQTTDELLQGLEAMDTAKIRDLLREIDADLREHGRLERITELSQKYAA